LFALQGFVQLESISYLLHLAEMKQEDHKKLKLKVISRWEEEYKAYEEVYEDHPPDRYDRMGNLISWAEWLVLTRDLQYSIVSREIIDNIEIFTLWEGYPEKRYEVNLIIKPWIYAMVCDSEENALHVHNRLIFLVDQKLVGRSDV